MVSEARATRGRPEVTSHAEIEQAAFALFAERGFARTTLDAIAEKLGIGRRTLARYFQSKNDIPWGNFALTLDHFRALLDAQPADLATYVAVHRSVLEFNRFPDGAAPSHADRMRLILTTPELQAHSVLRYAEWRRVIADFVAERRGDQPGDLVPLMVGQVSLGLSLAAYETWLSAANPSPGELLRLLDASMDGLHEHFTPAQHRESRQSQLD